MENLWTSYSENQKENAEKMAIRYRACIDACKTERECVRKAAALAKAEGFADLWEIVRKGRSVQPGDKVYAVYMDKAIVLFRMGSQPLEQGMNILGAHIDSPRIDIKQNPLYDEEGLAYLDTHYYGGIKKYQWLSQPLAIHGVVAKKDGSVVDVVIGEEDEDPVFVITDLLVHLSGEQMERKAGKVIDGEKLDLLIGSKSFTAEGTVKDAMLEILNKQYGIEEGDFLSAELEIVPAGKSRDCGLDRSMVIGYGQDDRVCAFTSLFAVLDESNVEKTACCILVDKEEIGSTGATGMQSRFFEHMVAELMDRAGEFSELKLRRALRNSRMLSSDVSAAYDPQFSDRFEKKNSAYFGRGIVFNKYTGSRGKSGSNDANAEYIAFIREVMERNGVAIQTAELGAVDIGGGGTIAYILAQYGMEVIDSGIPVLSMHAPWEITCKVDIYEAYRGYRAFILEK